MPRRNGDRLLIGVIVFVFGIWAVFALIGSNSGAAQSNEECYFDPVTFEVICPDPTPTPMPTPTNTPQPKATLSASRTTIEVGESTLISGDVEPADADTMWVVGEGLSMSPRVRLRRRGACDSSPHLSSVCGAARQARTR